MSTINGRPRGVSVAQLTDNSGGTANDTLALVNSDLTGGIGLSSPTATTVNAELATIKNNFADLAAKVNAILTALA